MRRARRALLGLAQRIAALAAITALAATACGPPSGHRPPGELYPRYCAKCHGADGTGNPRQVGLYPNLDLTHSKLVGRGAHLAIFNRISQGYGPMPGFAHRLSLDEMNHLADYSMKLNHLNPATGERK